MKRFEQFLYSQHKEQSPRTILKKEIKNNSGINDEPDTRKFCDFSSKKSILARNTKNTRTPKMTL